MPEKQKAKWLGAEPTNIELDRCVSNTKVKRAPGQDGFVAELLKYGGKRLRKKVYNVVREMWSRAAEAEDGDEAEEWPASWKVGLVVPLWKKKGKKSDKNTWRGVTLLSVGTKLLARVVAQRLSQWSDPWLNENQCGFRRGRGCDDALQVTRKIVEEATRAKGCDLIALKFYDIEKAYPRVAKDAMWELMRRRGSDYKMIKVCKALHEHTSYMMKMLGGTSSSWKPDRGLREGCPSSPPLFNIYHDGVMQDFRKRREVAATAVNKKPGLGWHYKVDGRVSIKGFRARLSLDPNRTSASFGTSEKSQGGGWAREVRETVIGDVGFADDTMLAGDVDEMQIADGILVQTLTDWAEKVNVGKSEQIITGGVSRNEMDVRRPGELENVRQLGAIINERGKTRPDTVKRVSRGNDLARSIAKAWGIGSKHGRGRNSGLNISNRLRVMRGTVIPAITTFARSRAWTKGELAKLQRVANYAVRRAMGMDVFCMFEHDISDKMMYESAGWESMNDHIRRATLLWVGHVSRMPLYRRPKQAFFGWWACHLPKHGSGGIKLQATWVRQAVRDAGLTAIDWFRVAQDRKAWRKTVHNAFPVRQPTKEREEELDRWTLGNALPGMEARPVTVEAPEGAQTDEGARQEAQGDWEDRAVEWGYRYEEESESSDDGEEEREEGALWECPVCGQGFEKGNQLQYHYDEEHGIRNQEIVTSIAHRCEDCKIFFARRAQFVNHVCEAKTARRTRETTHVGGWMPVREGPAPPPPEGWVIATDGSGKSTTVRGNTIKTAGWGVVIFRYPLEEDGAPDYVLHAPVVTQEWNHLWLGAREKTNNTGELSAIGEALIWLLEECPDDGRRPVLLRYDSEYAARMTQGIWTPEANEELIATVRGLLENVLEKRVVIWEHVFSHTGQHDNELADEAADRGTRGEVSQFSRRWAAPFPPLPSAVRAKAKAKARAERKAGPRAKHKAKAKGKAKAKPKTHPRR